MKIRYVWILLIAFMVGCTLLVRPIGGNFRHDPLEMGMLSAEARDLVEDSFKGVDKSRLADMHTHLAGIGTGNSGVWINPSMTSGWDFYRRIQYHVYMSASGVTDDEIADQQYVERLLKLATPFGPKFKMHILAFDYFYHKNGMVDAERSTFYVPNEYVYELSEKYRDRFVPVMSINPYRKDAISELKKWAGKGINKLKWLPNSQGINPADKALIPFYQVMKELKVTLLSHGGEEKAVDGEESQALGNPMLLRLPLDLGVKVIVAHMASLGDCDDLDNPGRVESCYKLFIKMMEEPKYEGLLFGDISGITIHTRVDHLKDILSRQHFHKRLLNGSDYPLPGVNIIYKTGKLVDMGFLTEKERELVNEIYSFNPLLFDFVLKRVIKDQATGNKFSGSAFEMPDWYL